MATKTTKEDAKRMFLDTRYYGKYRMDRANGADYGTDLKQLLVARMRTFIPNAPCGVERERERDNERNRLVNAITKPWNRWQFQNALEELLHYGEDAFSLGIVTRGNPAYSSIKELPEGELDETKVFFRAQEYCKRMIIAASEHKWLFYKIMVLGVGFREWHRTKDGKMVKYRPFGYYQKH